jgi:putative transposase
MSVRGRIWYPNTSYHITARGNRRNDIFKDEEDFQIYITLMENAIDYFENKFVIICYCLMDNHIHIMLETKDMHFKNYITRINSIYAKFFNHKYNYIGHLYQDRYFSELIETDSQALETSRYIHLNPVRANMVIKPEEYKWSSYAMYIGETKEKLINSRSILNYFKSRQAYKTFVEQGINHKYDKEIVRDGISS